MCESNERGKEKNNIETLKTVKVEEDPLPPTPEVSHSVEGYLGNYTPTPMDTKLAEVFDGKNIQNNDGTHLDCEIVDDKVWQEKYSSIIIYPLSQYDIPKGPIWKSFLQLIAKEIGRVWESKWNMEKVTCFISMIIHRSPDLKGCGVILSVGLSDGFWNGRKC